MKSLARTTFFILFLLLNIVDAQAQVFSVNIDVKNYTNDTLIVGNYFGEKQVVKDTLFSKGNGKFLWSETEMPAQGVYLLLLKPENTFIQFIINGTEDKFNIEFDSKDLLDISFKGSAENKHFYEYLSFLKDKRILADTLKARSERAKAKNEKDTDSDAKLENLDKEVKKFQVEFIKKHPTSLSALLIKSNTEIEIPEFTGPEDTIRYRKYYYYKEHYFDNIDMKHPSLIRTPFIHQKVDYYINKLWPQQPDSLMKAIDVVLHKLEGNNDAYRYYLADFLNNYAQMKMVGYDAIYVYMIDKYYSKGKATWVTEENLKKMVENAEELRPILIGKTMPNIVTYKEDGTPVKLSDVKSPYTVIIFWAPDCGHCKKIMPNVVDFYKKFKDKGVKMIGVCTKSGDKTNTCWPAVIEKGMEDFINTADEYGRYNMQVRIKSTPKIFILDEKKEIIVKDIPGEDIEKIFNDILSFEEKKRTAKQ